MLVAEPRPNSPSAHFGAVATRQLSVWPFAARTARLFLLVDPSLPDQGLRRGLLRAMQQAYFRSDGCSQTRAVREAALAAHYVLREHNREVLQLDRLSCATAVAAVRGDVTFVALAGDASVFAWRDGVLTGQRGIVRLPRPLGLEPEPCVTLWSTPLLPGDRLVLVCGAHWKRESRQVIEDVLRAQNQGASRETAEDNLAMALGGKRAAGVLIVDGNRQASPERHLSLVGAEPGVVDRIWSKEQTASSDARPSLTNDRRWLSSLLALLLLTAAALVAFRPFGDSPRATDASQAEALLLQADQTADPSQAHTLASSALDLAHKAAASAPAEYGDLVARASRELDQVDQVFSVTPWMAVRLGTSGSNVVDLAVGEDALYTLDVVESSVRAFSLDGRDQQPTPDTVVVRSGAPIGPGSHRLAPLVGIQYLTAHQPDQSVLAIVDQARSVVQVGHDRALTMRAVPSSASWQQLGALGADVDGHLLVLDSGAERLLEYPSFSQRLVDPPRLLLDGRSASDEVALQKATEVIGQQDQFFVRMDDGTLRRFDAQGNQLAFRVQAPDGQLTAVTAVTADREGGLYLADPAHARILHTTPDGDVLRQLRDPALAGVRLIQSSPDGRRIYGLLASGVLVFDIPE